MPKMSKEYLKQYITAKHVENYDCEVCGGHYKKYFKKVHCSSKKHQTAQSKIEEEKQKNNLTEHTKLMNENKTLHEELQEAISQIRIFKASIQ